MRIRPASIGDLERVMDIDGTIESSQYLHLERTGEGFARAWRLELRPLREKLVQGNPLDDEQRFALRQVVSGADEGLALAAEHGKSLVALALAQPRPALGTLHVLDLRVDYDQRRQGLGSALMYQVIQHARQSELRAVSAETRTSNLPANQLLQKLGFELAGLDTHRWSNHDLVKEAATVFWYAALD